MAGRRISRRQLASYVADGLLAGDRKRLEQLAAHLVQTNRTKEAELIVRDIELALLHRGHVVADVASANPLTDDIRAALTAFIEQHVNGVTKVALRETTDTSLLGGVAVSIPGRAFDATIRQKINALKRAQQ